MAQQMFLDFIVKKATEHHPDFFIRMLKKYPFKIEHWVVKNLNDWEQQAIGESGEFFSCDLDTTVEEIMKHFKNVFLQKEIYH